MSAIYNNTIDYSENIPGLHKKFGMCEVIQWNYKLVGDVGNVLAHWHCKILSRSNTEWVVEQDTVVCNPSPPEIAWYRTDNIDRIDWGRSPTIYIDAVPTLSANDLVGVQPMTSSFEEEANE